MVQPLMEIPTLTTPLSDYDNNPRKGSDGERARHQRHQGAGAMDCEPRRAAVAEFPPEPTGEHGCSLLRAVRRYRTH